MAFFGLKLVLDLEMRAAHPHQKFQGIPHPPGSLPSMTGHKKVDNINFINLKLFSELNSTTYGN